jgi:hypothetical protein
MDQSLLCTGDCAGSGMGMSVGVVYNEQDTPTPTYPTRTTAPPSPPPTHPRPHQHPQVLFEVITKFLSTVVQVEERPERIVFSSI